MNQEIQEKFEELAPFINKMKPLDKPMVRFPKVNYLDK